MEKTIETQSLIIDSKQDNNDNKLKIIDIINKHTDNHIDILKILNEELDSVNEDIESIEKHSAKLYSIRKQLTNSINILSGQSPVTNIIQPNEKTTKERKKKSPFKKIKSEIITDSVIRKISNFLLSKEEHVKSREIYDYLVENKIIEPFSESKDPYIKFGLLMGRIDQKILIYDKNLKAYGLEGFGTPAQLRRKSKKLASQATYARITSSKDLVLNGMPEMDNGI